VSLLVLGGLLVSGLTLNEIGAGHGMAAGFHTLAERVPEKFHMILSRDNPYYKDLPGLSVLLGGLWVMNLSYWGFNQYIIQRALAAKNLNEAQKGIVFAAYLKLLMPFVIVLPGIAAAVLAPHLDRPDQAYPAMMRLLPPGILGLVFAALIAAIVSSTASKINSIATIFTLDIYNQRGGVHSEARLVRVGRVAATVAIILAMLTAKPLLGSFDQAFQYIQEYTGFFTRNLRDISPRSFLEARNGTGSNRRGVGLISVVDRAQITVAGTAVHGSSRSGVRSGTGARDRRVLADAAADRSQLH
jgi:SSS family solute:Na+ symporter